MIGRLSDLTTSPFAKFKPLVGVEPSQLTSSFEQVAKALHGASFAGVVRFTLVGDPQPQSFTIAVSDGTAKLQSDAKTVDLEIITAPECWLAIVRGTLSPLDAFTQGKLRVRGDQTLGQRIMKRLAGDRGRLEFC